jgi:hypothetical protein
LVVASKAWSDASCIRDPKDISGVTLRAQRRASLKPFQCEDRLAQQIAVGMKKRWPETTGYSRAHDLDSSRTRL